MKKKNKNEKVVPVYWWLEPLPYMNTVKSLNSVAANFRGLLQFSWIASILQVYGDVISCIL